MAGANPELEDVSKQMSKYFLDGIREGLPSIGDAAKEVIGQITGGDAGTTMADNFKSGSVGDKDTGGVGSFLAEGANLVSSAFSSVSTSYKKLLSDASSSDLGFSEIASKMTDMSSTFTKNLSGSLNKTLGIDFSALIGGAKEVGEAFSPLMNLESVLSSVVTVKTIGALSSFKKGVADIEGVMMQVDRAAALASAGFVSFKDTGSGAFTSSTDSIKAYREESKNFVASTGKSISEFYKFTDELNSANLSFDTITKGMNNFSVNVGTGLEPITKLEGIMAIAKGTGIETKDVFADLNLFTKSLGVSTEEAAMKYGLFSEVIKGTQVNAREARQHIMSSAKELRFYGDTTRGTSQIYRNFLGALGTGQEGIAGELLAKATGALAGMDDGLKAFVGTVGGIGSGAGGVLGNALDVELAIEEGRSDEVLESMKNIIEAQTGAPLLSKREAVDSGQTSAYMMQRNLVQQMGLASSGAEASKMIEALRDGVMGIRLDEKKGIQAVVGAGRERLDTETGPGEKLLNSLEAGGILGGTKGTSEKMTLASNKLHEASSTLEGGASKLLSVGNKLGDMWGRLFGDKGTQDSEEKTTAVQELSRGRDEALAGASTGTGILKESESSPGASSQLNKSQTESHQVNQELIDSAFNRNISNDLKAPVGAENKDIDTSSKKSLISAKSEEVKSAIVGDDSTTNAKLDRLIAASEIKKDESSIVLPSPENKIDVKVMIDGRELRGALTTIVEGKIRDNSRKASGSSIGGS